MLFYGLYNGPILNWFVFFAKTSYFYYISLLLTLFAISDIVKLSKIGGQLAAEGKEP